MNEVEAPRIWTHRPKIIEAREVMPILGPRMTGEYKLEAVRPDGRRRLLADWFPNLITDVGLNVAGTDASWLAYCRVGTGSTAPANSDTGLAGQLAETNTVQATSASALGSTPYYNQVVKTYRFGAGVAAGNLAEIGIANRALADANDVLFSRALILDSSGDPTTITVLSDEFLDATYRFRMYPPIVDNVHTVNISGTDYTVTDRASSVNDTNVWSPSTNLGFLGGISSGSAYDGAIGALTTTPSGTSVFNSTAVNASYGNNNLYRDATCTWGLTAANFAGGIDAIRLVMGATGGGGVMQFGFVAPIPKTASTILALVFRHSWARGSI